MNTYRLPCSLGVPAPALVVERAESSYSGWHTHDLKAQLGTLGEEGPTHLPWNDARRAVRLLWQECGRAPLATSVSIEAQAFSSDPAHLRAIADHLEEVQTAWSALIQVLGPPVTGEGFLRRVGVLLGAEEAVVLQFADGGAQVECFGPLEEVCRAIDRRECAFRARVLPDPFAEMEDLFTEAAA